MSSATRRAQGASVGACLVVCLLGAFGAAAALGTPGATAATETVVLGGVTVHPRPDTRQVVTVNHTRGYHAQVTLWRRASTRWVRDLGSGNGRTGYGGLVVGTRRRQGTGTTPMGSYRLVSSFGTHPRAMAWRLPYRRIGSWDYWVEDNGSAYYNRYRNRFQGGFRWRLPPSAPNSSERLSDYPRQYEYAVVIGFNYAHPVRHRGAGIFLHVNGSGATAGCVSVPRRMMRTLMGRLRPAQDPMIAIGR